MVGIGRRTVLSQVMTVLVAGLLAAALRASHEFADCFLRPGGVPSCPAIR